MRDKDRIRNILSSGYVRLLLIVVVPLVAFLFPMTPERELFFAACLALFAFFDRVLKFVFPEPTGEERIAVFVQRERDKVRVTVKRQEHIITQITERIPPPPVSPPPIPSIPLSTQEEITKLNWTITHLRSSMKTRNITAYEIVSSYDEPIKAILLMKFHETVKGEKSKVLKQKLEELGFKHLQGGARILPPLYTPRGLNSQEDLKQWIHKNVTEPLGMGLEYVLPFATLLDMRMVFSERVGEAGARLVTMARTVFEVVKVDEINPYAVLSYLEKTHVSMADLIRQGDIVFLASKVSPSPRDSLERSKEVIMQELSRATREEIDLSYFSSMDEERKRQLSRVLRRHDVRNANAVAEGIIREAKYWDDFLTGTAGQKI